MSHRFNFTQCIELLHTNAKTFARWLEDDGIDAAKQRDLADPRQKYLTEEQLVLMARKREIDLQLPDPEDKGDISTRILAEMHSSLAGLEQQMSGRFDQLVGETQTAIADLRHDLTARLDQMEVHLSALHDELVQARLAGQPASSQERLPLPIFTAGNAAAATPPPAPTATMRTKRPTRTRAKAKKPLPRTLTPLTIFRQAHGISEKAVENAVQREKLSVRRGAWLYQHRYITTALDRQGQQQFYALFSERETFKTCGACPHGESSQASG